MVLSIWGMRLGVGSYSTSILLLFVLLFGCCLLCNHDKRCRPLAKQLCPGRVDSGGRGGRNTKQEARNKKQETSVES